LLNVLVEIANKLGLPKKNNVESEEVWSRYITLRITGLMDFVHPPDFEITRKHNVSENESTSALRWREGDTCSIGSIRRC
jgi:hypothetical protein